MKSRATERQAQRPRRFSYLILGAIPCFLLASCYPRGPVEVAYAVYLEELDDKEKQSVEKGASLLASFSRVLEVWESSKPPLEDPDVYRTDQRLRQLDWLNHLMFYCMECTAEQAKGGTTEEQLTSLYQRLDSAILTDSFERLERLEQACEAADLAFGAYPAQASTRIVAACLRGLRFRLAESVELELMWQRDESRVL